MARRAILRGATALTALAGCVLALTAVAWSHGREEPLAVTGLVLVDRRDVEEDEDVVEETYGAVLMHTGQKGGRDLANVHARLVRVNGHGPKRAVVDGDLFFGSVRAGQKVESQDTFTIRRRRGFRLKPQHLRWAIAARPDLLLSEAWAGSWALNVTSRDGATGAVTTVDEITDTLGADGPVGFSLLPRFVRCKWSGSDLAIRAHCAVRARLRGCLLEGKADFTLERDGETLQGNGHWQGTSEGDCPSAGTSGESLEIEGLRLGGHAETGRFSQGALLTFGLHPALVALAGAGVEERALLRSDDREPDDDEEKEARKKEDRRSGKEVTP